MRPMAKGDARMYKHFASRQHMRHRQFCTCQGRLNVHHYKQLASNDNRDPLLMLHVLIVLLSEFVLPLSRFMHP